MGGFAMERVPSSQSSPLHNVRGFASVPSSQLSTPQFSTPRNDSSGYSTPQVVRRTNSEYSTPCSPISCNRNLGLAKAKVAASGLDQGTLHKNKVASAVSSGACTLQL